MINIIYKQKNKIKLQKNSDNKIIFLKSKILNPSYTKNLN